MREFAKVSNSLWASERFNKLCDTSKLFYLYLLTCQHSNSAGCFKIKTGYMCADLNWPENSVFEAIRKVSQVGLIAYDTVEHTLYIWNWYTFNSPQNPKHAAKIINDISAIPYSSLRDKIISDFIKDLKSKKWAIHEKSQIILDRVSSKRETETTKTETKTETVDDVIGTPDFSCYRKSVSDRIGEIMGWNNNPNWFGDYSRLDSWLSGGWSPELDIFPTIERIRKNHKGSEIKTLKYFEQAIADAYANRLKPAPKGTPNATRKLTKSERIDAALEAGVREIERSKQNETLAITDKTKF